MKRDFLVETKQIGKGLYKEESRVGIVERIGEVVYFD